MKIPVTETPDVSDAMLQELVLYICNASEGDEAFGATKLNKLLFFCDFEHYRATGRSITGHDYVKQEFGPVPKGMPEIMMRMHDEDKIAIREESATGGYVRKRPVGLRTPNVSKFTSEQIDLVHRVIRRFQAHNASCISEFSHQFIGWKVARTDEVIPYSVSLVEQRDLTAQEISWGKEMVTRINEYPAIAH
jgi:hypothetical protein